MKTGKERAEEAGKERNLDKDLEIDPESV